MDWKKFWAPMTQEMKIMASGPITSWEIDGETVETVSDIIFLGSKTKWTTSSLSSSLGPAVPKTFSNS